MRITLILFILLLYSKFLFASAEVSNECEGGGDDVVDTLVSNLKLTDDGRFYILPSKAEIYIGSHSLWSSNCHPSTINFPAFFGDQNYAVVDSPAVCKFVVTKKLKLFNINNIDGINELYAGCDKKEKYDIDKALFANMENHRHLKFSKSIDKNDLKDFAKVLCKDYDGYASKSMESELFSRFSLPEVMLCEGNAIQQEGDEIPLQGTSQGEIDIRIASELQRGFRMEDKKTGYIPLPDASMDGSDSGYDSEDSITGALAPPPSLIRRPFNL